MLIIREKSVNTVFTVRSHYAICCLNERTARREDQHNSLILFLIVGAATRAHHVTAMNS
jgi:hypothetical protein